MKSLFFTSLKWPQRSKYDFWIPDKILTLETKNQIKTQIFWDQKIWSTKKSGKFFGPNVFSYPKIRKNWFFEKIYFSKIIDFLKDFQWKMSKHFHLEKYFFWKIFFGIFFKSTKLHRILMNFGSDKRFWKLSTSSWT